MQGRTDKQPILADRPHGFPIPMLIPLAGFAIGLWLDRGLPALGAGVFVRMLGLALLAGGGWMAARAVIEMRQAQVDPLPNRTAARLLTTGVFGLSRNPIYLGAVAALAGLALALSSLGVLISVPVVAIALDRLVITAEEAHLSARFPGEFAAWSARVRRWL